jgi:hypothetical protein
VLPQLVDFNNGHSVEDHGHPAEIKHVRDGELVGRASYLLRITNKSRRIGIRFDSRAR